MNEVGSIMVHEAQVDTLENCLRGWKVFSGGVQNYVTTWALAPCHWLPCLLFCEIKGNRKTPTPGLTVPSSPALQKNRQC